MAESRRAPTRRAAKLVAVASLARGSLLCTTGTSHPSSGSRGKIKWVRIKWRPLAWNTLKRFLTLALPTALRLQECSLHKNDGHRWIALPSRPQIDAEGRHRWDPAGKKLYVAIVEIPDKTARERFQAALATLDELLLGAGGEL